MIDGVIPDPFDFLPSPLRRKVLRANFQRDHRGSQFVRIKNIRDQSTLSMWFLQHLSQCLSKRKKIINEQQMEKVFQKKNDLRVPK